MSHDTAAAHYDLGDILPAKYHLTIPPAFRKKAPEGVTLHKAKLVPSDIETRDAVPVTKPLRTIEDLTLAHMDPERLSAIVKDAVQKGLVTRTELLKLSSSLAEKAKQAQTVLDIAISEVGEQPYSRRSAPNEPSRVKETADTWNRNKPSIRQLLLELKSELGSIYREQLKGVYLFGSYARGEADPESDLDVLVVLQAFDRYAQEVDRTGALAADLSLKHGVSISLVFMREQEWLRGDNPFLVNVREEAIPA
ncbi:MAG TPA: nucleotidyltransferase domain-containing protein [Terriglobales bacterium]|nr:nucleotidyltransferase domain-containing protein [Terriglobales bacterium]